MTSAKVYFWLNSVAYGLLIRVQICFIKESWKLVFKNNAYLIKQTHKIYLFDQIQVSSGSKE